MTAESKPGDGGDFSQRHAALRVIENLVRYWIEQMLLQAPLASSAIIQIHLLQCSSPAGSEGVQSYTVNIIQEAMIGVMPLPHGAKAGGVAGAAGGKALNRMPNSDATSLQGLSGRFLWRYSGGWAVHGGVDFADVARGLQDKVTTSSLCVNECGRCHDHRCYAGQYSLFDSRLGLAFSVLIQLSLSNS